MPRKARLKHVTQDSCMHLYNHVACGRREYPLTDRAKEHFIRRVQSLSTYFQAEIVSVTVMSNHFHICAFCSGDMFSDQEVVDRYNLFYADNDRHPQIELTDQHIITHERLRMHDVSEFMKELQCGFSRWFNKAIQPDRMGTLWAGRYKSTILQASESRAAMGNSALFHCVKYVELNPFRAGMVDDPGDYEFSTWGIFETTGNHPFATNFLRQIRRVLGERGATMTDEQVYNHLRAEMARSCASERALEVDKSFELEVNTNEDDPTILTLTKKFRYWIDGGIIGTKEFVNKAMIHFNGAEKAEKHHVVKLHGQHENEGTLCAFHRLKKVS